MFTRPRRVYLLLVPAAIVALAVSGIGSHATPSTGGPRYWVGATGWATFGLLLAAIGLYTLALGIRALARRRTPTPTVN